MPTKHLPDHPNLDHLRQQAKALQREVRSGDAVASSRVEDRYPGGIPADPAEFGLSEAQLVVAREYGFPSWSRLKHYLQTVADYSWEIAPASEDPVIEFCRLACLIYTPDDHSDARGRARDILAEHPKITADNIWVAATAADRSAVERLLSGDPSLASRRGGPNRCSPLFYLAYSRLDPEVTEDRVLGIARLLLDHGADPNEGYLWNGGPYAFTVLTGVFGEGEQGPVHQPRHPHCHALARLLLDAGADPVDDQVLYNRMFRPGNDHLELLFEYGLASGDRPGPWRERMTDVHQEPAGKLRFQLRWAIEHGFTDRIRLLAAHGVDLETPFADGRTPLVLAELYGGDGVVEALRAAGVSTASTEDPVDRLVAAAFRADRAAVDALLRDHPGIAEQVRQRRKGMLTWAAARPNRSETVRLLVSIGIDVNGLGRGDHPADTGWVEGWGGELVKPGEPHESALHMAAHRGDLELAQTLLELGADPNLLDGRFNATPLGWAQHAESRDGADRQAMITLLTPLTSADR